MYVAGQAKVRNGNSGKKRIGWFTTRAGGASGTWRGVFSGKWRDADNEGCSIEANIMVRNNKTLWMLSLVVAWAVAGIGRRPRPRQLRP